MNASGPATPTVSRPATTSTASVSSTGPTPRPGRPPAPSRREPDRTSTGSPYRRMTTSPLPGIRGHGWTTSTKVASYSYTCSTRPTVLPRRTPCQESSTRRRHHLDGVTGIPPPACPPALHADLLAPEDVAQQRGVVVAVLELVPVQQGPEVRGVARRGLAGEVGLEPAAPPTVERAQHVAPPPRGHSLTPCSLVAHPSLTRHSPGPSPPLPRYAGLRPNVGWGKSSDDAGTSHYGSDMTGNG